MSLYGNQGTWPLGTHGSRWRVHNKLHKDLGVIQVQVSPLLVCQSASIFCVDSLFTAHQLAPACSYQAHLLVCIGIIHIIQKSSSSRDILAAFLPPTATDASPLILCHAAAASKPPGPQGSKPPGPQGALGSKPPGPVGAGAKPPGPQGSKPPGPAGAKPAGRR